MEIAKQIRQEYRSYSIEDHRTWKQLVEKHFSFTDRNVSQEFLTGFLKLKINKEKIADISEVSKTLKSITAWTLVPVTGLIPPKDYFYLLANKEYPININLRKPSEIDFSDEPDIFHDVCGHLAILTNEVFSQFITSYSKIVLKFINNDRAVKLLQRLYWFTYETGLIKVDGLLRSDSAEPLPTAPLFLPFGAAIITSSEESKNVENALIPKHPFDLDHIFQTDFSYENLQKEYFYINSFDDLFECIKDLESNLNKYLIS